MGIDGVADSFIGKLICNIFYYFNILINVINIIITIIICLRWITHKINCDFKYKLFNWLNYEIIFDAINMFNGSDDNEDDDNH